jgi:copper homeostasis protein (lipoprotein)
MSLVFRRSAFALSLALLAVAVAGCDGARERAGADAQDERQGGLAPLPEVFEGTWAGVLPCADCDGLEVVLELQREAGAAGRYRQVESYLGAPEAADFELAGEWREEACRVGDAPGRCVLLLESGQRWFRGADGTLQAVDADGRAVDPDSARLQRQ